MIASAVIWIRDLMQSWQEYPSRVYIDSQLASVEEIPFPAVTICTTFEPDKWEFLRNLLNLIDFKCNGDVSCGKTQRFA